VITLRERLDYATSEVVYELLVGKYGYMKELYRCPDDGTNPISKVIQAIRDEFGAGLTVAKLIWDGRSIVV